MTSFRFRLEPVLEVRARREEVLQLDLARAVCAAAAQQEAAVSAARDADRAHEELRQAQGGPIALHELRALHDGLDRARAIAVHEMAGAERLDVVADERRAELVRASQDREALIGLKRRQAADHARELERIDIAALDELALRRHRARAVRGTAVA